MKDSEKYIVDYLNNVGAKFSLCTKSILKEGVSDNEYKTINNEINKYISVVTHTLNKVNLKSVPVNDFFNNLYLLKDLPNRSIHAMLKQFDYESVIKEGYRKSVKKIREGKIPKKDNQKVMDFLIENHFPFDDKQEIYDFYLKYTLLNEKPISLNALRSLIIDFTKSYMEKYVSNPEVYIIERNKLENAIGYSHENKIWLCDEDVRRLYKYGFFRLIETIFHELMHVSQYKDIMIDKKDDERCITMIKDEILSNILEDYYQDNHLVLLSEVEANIAYRKNLLAFFEKINLTLVDKKGDYQGAIDEYKKLLKYKRRMVDKKMHDLDEIFDNKIMFHPEYLGVYEQLNTEYKLDFDDIVVRRDDFYDVSPQKKK